MMKLNRQVVSEVLGMRCIPFFLLRVMVRDFQRPSLWRLADVAVAIPEPRSKVTLILPSDNSRVMKSF